MDRVGSDPTTLRKTSLQHPDDISDPLNGVNPPNDMLASAIERGPETVDVHLFHRQFIGVNVEHIKMNVVEGFHQAGYLHDVG